MFSIYRFKPAFRRLLAPLANRLHGVGISANAVTLAGLLICVGWAGAMILAPGSAVLLALPAVLLVRMVLNAMDGLIAGKLTRPSASGTVLNEMGDVLSDLAIILPFALTLPGLAGSLMIGLGFVAVLTELAGVMAVQIGAPRRYDGPMGKADRALVLGTVALALGLGVSPDPWLAPLLGAVMALGVLTVLNRLRAALHSHL